MSNFFDDKNYNDYFEKLNTRLNSVEKKSDDSNPKPNKKGYYKVIRLKRRTLAIALVLVILIIVGLSVKGCKKETSEKPNLIGSTQTSTITEKQPKKVTFKAAGGETFAIPESNDAKTAIIIRLSDKAIIAERGANERIFPASTLKIMTLLTAVDHIKNLNDTFTMTYEITDPLYVADASVAGFLNGEKVTMKDLLYGMILPSGADSAMALAIKIAGSEEAFVKLMNQKAKELGLKNTHFTNVSGLHNVNNYSTAYDMAIITYHAMQNDLCRKILSTYQHTTKKTPQNPEGILLSSTLFSYMYGDEPETAVISGGKTGYVNESGYCISSFGKASETGEEYIVVTMSNSSLWPAIYGQINLYKEFVK